MSYANRGELKTAVRAWLAETNTNILPDSVIEDAIGFVEADLITGVWGPRGRPFRVLEMQAVKSTTIIEDGEEFVSLPDDFISMRYVYVTTSSEKQTLRYATPEDFVNSQLDSGDSMFYTMSGGQIRVKPTLAEDDVVEMGYYQDIPALDSDETTNWLLARNPQAYLYGSLSHLSVYLDNDRKLAAVSAGYERAVLGQINGDIRRQVGEGPVTMGSHEVVA